MKDESLVMLAALLGYLGTVLLNANISKCDGFCVCGIGRNLSKIVKMAKIMPIKQGFLTRLDTLDDARS